MGVDVPRGMEDPTVLLREVSRNEGHTKVAVFVGRGRGSRGYAGTLTLRTDEWDSLSSDFHGLSDPTYLIVGEETDDDGRPLCWSNADGWVPREQADRFDHAGEILPIGGRWERIDLLDRIDCEGENPPPHEPADVFSGGRRRPCPDGGTMTYVGDDEGSLAQGGDYEVWDCTVHGRVYLSLPD